MKKDLSTAQVARRLGVSARKVREMIRTGVLRAYRIGDGKKPHYRVRPEDVERIRVAR